MHIGLENSLLLAPFIGILLAQPHDRAQCLDVEAVGLGLGINVPNIVADRFFLFLQPLDALDEGLQMILRKRAAGRSTAAAVAINPPPVTSTRERFGSAAAEVKAGE